MTNRIILFIVLLTTISYSSYSQTKKKWRGNYLLNGQIENTQIRGELTLLYTTDTKRGLVSDTLAASVSDGRFSFSGYLEEPTFATLFIEDQQISFFLDPSIIDIQIASNLQDFTIKGSPTSEEYLEIEKLRKGFQEKNKNQLELLYKEKEKFSVCETETIDYKNLISEISKLESQAALAPLTFAAKEKNSFAVLKAMNDFLDKENKYYKKEVCAQMMRIYALMPEYTKDTPTGVNVSGKLLKAKMNMQF